MVKATKKDLSWFNLNNYAFLNNLTLEDLIEELELRRWLFESLEQSNSVFEYEVEMKRERIFNGDPHISILNQKEQEHENAIRAINDQAPSLKNMYGELPKLSSGEGIRPITFSELAMYSFSAIDEAFFYRDEEYTSIKSNAMLASVTGNLDCFGNSVVLTNIYLDDATDDEILTDLKRLLPLWREQLSSPEQDHLSQKRIGLKTLQKLIINRVVPILDLLLWGMVSNKEITNPMLGLLVFSDDPKDTQAIKESIKPFALEAMSNKYTRLLRLYVNKDSEIGSTKISALMRRDS